LGLALAAGPTISAKAVARIFFFGNKAQRSEPCRKKMVLVAAL
jgi:hypothetical protein